MCVMRLLKSERLVRLVRLSSPEISEMLLNLVRGRAGVSVRVGV